mmetsp:Transcript_2074/g.6134  ORF Transcript_2074/g.6134 Transcript_2074/m.6134 type:complete len:416 (-) Transcript_2074:2563-3810(-)
MTAPVSAERIKIHQFCSAEHAAVRKLVPCVMMPGAGILTVCQAIPRRGHPCGPLGAGGNPHEARYKRGADLVCDVVMVLSLELLLGAAEGEEAAVADGVHSSRQAVHLGPGVRCIQQIPGAHDAGDAEDAGAGVGAAVEDAGPARGQVLVVAAQPRRLEPAQPQRRTDQHHRRLQAMPLPLVGSQHEETCGRPQGGDALHGLPHHRLVNTPLLNCLVTQPAAHVSAGDVDGPGEDGQSSRAAGIQPELGGQVHRQPRQDDERPCIGAAVHAQQRQHRHVGGEPAPRDVADLQLRLRLGGRHLRHVGFCIGGHQGGGLLRHTGVPPGSPGQPRGAAHPEHGLPPQIADQRGGHHQRGDDAHRTTGEGQRQAGRQVRLRHPPGKEVGDSRHGNTLAHAHHSAGGHQRRQVTRHAGGG